MGRIDGPDGAVAAIKSSYPGRIGSPSANRRRGTIKRRG
jgi:hypothetical protein